ncbi:nucleic acid binding domain protein [Neobacillus bataviensis LMG 21833]|uniref:Nucleic acid binding domain protein n=1 Tax=Neobacillus bataviensis LMG 21833 TaxID=1117379 RepID=K6E9P5_9BACI|nr:TIGR03943 family protein [Neobacillus bataviensis]EKN70081.1 nucleic acid binding domain protein [Neobacillus bataviensis LMG 21833]
MNRKNIKKNSYHHFIRGVILVGFMLLLLKLLLTNHITLFIAPKMNGFIYFTLFVFLILGVLLIFRSTSEDNTYYECGCEGGHSYPKSIGKSLFLYSIFIIPIITGLLFADHVLGSSVAKNRTLKLGADSQNISITQTEKNNKDVEKNQSISEPSQPNPISDPSSSEMPEPLTQTEYSSLTNKLIQSTSVNVTDASYVPMINIIQDNLDKMIGKTITVKGFIYREKNFFQDQIVVARYGITCCVADASVYGIMAKGNVSGLPKDKWIQVTGTIDQTKYDGSKIPIIKIQDYKIISVPKQPYVYDAGVRID